MSARRVVLIVWSIAAAAVFIVAARGMSWADLLVVALAVAYVYGARIAFRGFVRGFCASERRYEPDAEPDYVLAAFLGVIVGALWPITTVVYWTGRFGSRALEAAGRRHGGDR